MAGDIAQLGIEVRTNGASDAASQLNGLSGAAARAEAAMNGVEASSQGAAGAASAAAVAFAREMTAASGLSGRISQLSTALNGMKASAANYSLIPRFDVAQISAMAAAMGQVERTSQAAAKAVAAEALATQRAANEAARFNAVANDNSAFAGGRHNIANIAAQFQDVAVSAQMGMSAMQIGLQQGTQLAAVISTMERPLQGLGAAFMSILSPVSLAVIAFVALAAALLQTVNWSKVGAAALNGLADILELIAPYAVAAAAGLALIYAPAIVGGIVSLIALLGRLTTQVLAVAAAFAVANPGAAFVLGLVAVVAAMNIFRDELAAIFGRDIVADVKNAANFIIGAFVGAFNGIRAVWAALPAVIGDAVYQTANAVIAGIEFMMNAVNERINSFIRGINSMMASLPFGVGDGVSIGEIPRAAIPRINNPHAGAMDSAASAVSTAVADAQKVDYVGKTYDVLGKAASTAAGKLREMASGLTSVDAAAKKSGASAKDAADKYKEIVDGANRKIATLQAEQAAVGLSAEAAAKLKYETDLLNQAQQANITLTAAQRAELSNLAGQMASVEATTTAAKANLELAKSSATGFLSTLRQGLVNGEGWWKSFGNAALSVLDKIASAIETQLVDALFSTSSPGGFNILSLFGLGSSVAAGGLSGTNVGATAAAAAPVAKMAGPVAKSAATVSGANVKVTVGLANDDLNIKPSVVEVVDERGRKIKAEVQASTKSTFENYRRNQLHQDISSHMRNPRRRGTI